MNICGAQTKPVTGNIEANIEKHLLFIDRALSHGADLIVFSELSLTGYEPTLARTLATQADDSRFNAFQNTCNKNKVVVGVGVPTREKERLFISMILFQPNVQPLIYSKKYLHADEDPFFVPGINFPSLKIHNTSIGFAICYELSIPEHSRAAHKSGAEVYVASVAKFARGVENAAKTLSDIAIKYSIPSMMINAIGPADNGVCTGNSAVWGTNGKLIGQLGNSEEGLIMYDTASGAVIEKSM